MKNNLFIKNTAQCRLYMAFIQIRLIDRFVGNLSPIFRSSRLEIDLHYNPPGVKSEPRYLEGVVRFTKLHGSLDWINDGRDIRRIGIPFVSPL